MKTKTVWGIGIAVVILGVFLIGCGGAEQTQTETPATQTAPPAAEPQTTTADATKPYPLDYCLVSGEKLGSMGAPPVRTYAGQEIKFCCAGCVETFEESPSMYIAKLDSAVAGQSMHGEMEGHEGHNH